MNAISTNLIYFGNGAPTETNVPPGSLYINQSQGFLYQLTPSGWNIFAHSQTEGTQFDGEVTNVTVQNGVIVNAD